MAKNQKNQSAAIRFCPALKVLFLCLLIAGLAVGYVWQKGQIYQLGRQITACEGRLVRLRDENQKLGDQLAVLRSPTMLDQRVRELSLGLVPAQPAQIYRLVEPPPNENSKRQFAARQNSAMTQ
jgi:cell division protein FtsB